MCSFVSFLYKLIFFKVYHFEYTWSNRDHLEPTTLLFDTDTDDMMEWIQIECGVYHTVGLTKNGQVFTWGKNDRGDQLGHGDYEDRSVPTKIESLDGTVITKISCCAYHTAVLTDKGEILTWYVRS